MNVKKAVEEIKLYIDSEQIKNKIALDLGLKFKNNKCLCFLHGESNPSMSFNPKTKKYKCFSCGASYDIFNHYQEYYNKSFVEAVKSIISDFNMNIELDINKIDRKAKKPPTAHNSYTPNILSYCNKRGISQKTLDYVGVKEKENCVVFEYRNELGEHISNKYRRTKQNKGPKMWFEKDTNINTLFNMDKINPGEPLLVTEGEFDCLSAIESGFKNAVSIPSGVNSTNEWINTNWTFLEQFEEIILWFDNDDPGRKGAREVYNRLSNDSVKIVNYTKHNDINEALYKEGKEEILEAIEKAQTPVIEGIYTLDNIEDFNIYEAEKLKTGFEAIDNKIIGMVFGSLNIFTGRNGAGKSTILNQMYIGEALRQNYKCFIFSGELVASNVKDWLISTLANEQDFKTIESKSGLIYKRVDNSSRSFITERIKDKIFLYGDEDYNINIILKKMEILAKRFGVKVFCIDNLMVIEEDLVDEYKMQTSIVKKLKNFAKKYNCMVHLVAHPRKSQNVDVNKDDVAGSANITNLADYVTSIERKFNEDGTDDITKLSILKNRHTGKNVSIELKYDDIRHRFYSSSMMEELNVNYLDDRFQQINIDDSDLPF